MSPIETTQVTGDKVSDFDAQTDSNEITPIEEPPPIPDVDTDPVEDPA